MTGHDWFQVFALVFYLVMLVGIWTNWFSKRPFVRMEIHYGELTWTSRLADKMRRKHCLCRHCDKFKPGERDNCPIAQRLYGECVDAGMAMTVTRCKYFGWKHKKGGRQCATCVKHGTINCPNSFHCYATKTLPYWEGKA